MLIKVKASKPESVSKINIARRTSRRASVRKPSVRNDKHIILDILEKFKESGGDFYETYS
jgi:hypothetical protein